MSIRPERVENNSYGSIASSNPYFKEYVLLLQRI
jgi:hypothetical protein